MNDLTRHEINLSSWYILCGYISKMAGNLKLYAQTLLLILVLSGTCRAVAVDSGQIIVGDKACELERYAARELQRYLYQISGQMLHLVSDAEPVEKPSFIIGREKTNAYIRKFRKNCG